MSLNVAVLILLLGREFKHNPTESGRLVEFSHISNIPLCPVVSPVRPNATINLNGDFILRYREVKSPPPFGVELVLLDALHPQVGLAYNREDIPYWRLIRRLSAFLCVPYNLLVHLN